ncbi:MAG TPA: phosphoribosyltransferase family protein [Candidatus Saccharimonadales bacterium]|nr:phosphoribosyltransferase family protein [Candidatus Saccharimonadales bacterium]
MRRPRVAPELPLTVALNGRRYETAMLLSEAAIQDQVDKMGRLLAARYEREGSVHVLTVMTGGDPYSRDLRDVMRHATSLDTLRMSSDQISMSSYALYRSSGVIRDQGGMKQDIAGKNVLVVEGIIASGLTLSWLIKNLADRGPKSIEVASAFMTAPDDEIKSLLGGLSINSCFDLDADPTDILVGYGLDHMQEFRDYGGLYRLSPLAAG